ncbi:MAG: BlaI/MecI/CopY family transcriptional regulator [Planctomycetaceae bacterium]|nr:BlaI/MecI/CopY family transcriptional regulator [Planctomycetales bacterium]MCB9926016.1 BlaI/MecI/CopY family transcriptional regulator [Planctomycetaceae bacterium]
MAPKRDSQRGALPKSELEIAKVVWDLGEATVRQVLDALPPDRELDFWTVQTYLRRLEAKGYLSKRREGRTNVYRPAVRPTTVISETMDDFINRLFDGEALPLFQHLIRDRGLSDAEIDELQQTLDALKAERKRGRSS